MKVSQRLASRVQTWTWRLIYAGMISVGLGVSLQRQGKSPSGPIIVGGGLLIVIGIVLVVWRSRMHIDATKTLDDSSRP